LKASFDPKLVVIFVYRNCHLQNISHVTLANTTHVTNIGEASCFPFQKASRLL